MAKPSPQQNLKVATERAFAALAHQPPEQFEWLGATLVGDRWRLPILDDAFDVDLSAGQVTLASSGEPVGAAWRILALHYLNITTRPEAQDPAITFADLATARSYAGIYQGRVISRFCYTAGRDGETFRTAATCLGGKPVDEGDAAFDFAMFPRVTVRLIWHAPDEEFPASATLLLPGNIDAYFCSEDTVVMSEQLVARLSGRGF